MDAIDHEPARPMEPVADPAAWYDADLNRTGAGTFTWDADEVADIEAAMAAFEAGGKDLVALKQADFPLGRAADKVAAIRREVVGGVGFALIHGLTMDTYTRRQAAIIFLGLGQHIGELRSQNHMGHILGHVKDLGFDQATDPLARAYHCRNELNYHSDSCNVVALFCLHHAMKGGVSRVSSGITVYNEMLKRRPELAAAISEPLHHDRRGEVPEGKERTWKLPIFCFTDGYLSVNAGRTYIDSAQRFPEVPKWTAHQDEGLAYFEELCLELTHVQDFNPGDMQFLNNHVVAHARTEFEDWPEEERKRHLFRLWLEVDGIRPLDPGFMERINGIVLPGMKLTAPLDAE